MTDDDAKRALAEMLCSFTSGSVLHLLGEVLRERAERDADEPGDDGVEQAREAESALFVFGLGLDAVCPR